MPTWETAAAYIMLVALGLAGTLVLRSRGERLRGLPELRAALLTAMGAIGLLALRGHVPLPVVAVGGQSALLMAFVFLHLSLARILGRSSRLGSFLAVLLPSYVLGLWYYSAVEQNLDARILIASTGIALLLAWTMRLLRQPDPAAPDPPLRWMFWVLAVAIGLRVLRCVVTLTVDPDPDLMQLNLVQGLFVYLILLSGVAQAAGTFWISVFAQREQYRTLAETDSLTGLLNRRAFEALLENELTRRRAEDVEISLLLVDLDFFKDMNDQFGHIVGDNVLRRVGAVLRHSVRPVDSLARIGGDEFAVLLHSGEPGQAMYVAERIRQGLMHMRSFPRPVGRKITASLGVATAIPGDTPLTLLDRADQALYRSKDLGRNRLTGSDDSRATPEEEDTTTYLQ